MCVERERERERERESESEESNEQCHRLVFGSVGCGQQRCGRQCLLSCDIILGERMLERECD